MKQRENIKIRKVVAGVYETTNTIPKAIIEKEEGGWIVSWEGYGSHWKYKADCIEVINNACDMGTEWAEATIRKTLRRAGWKPENITSLLKGK